MVIAFFVIKLYSYNSVNVDYVGFVYFLVLMRTRLNCMWSIWNLRSNSSLYQSSVYLVNYVFIVANEFLKGNNRLPRIILSVDATAGDLIVLVSGYSQRVSANKITKICSKIECKKDKCAIPLKLITKAHLDHVIPFSSFQPRGKTLLACELYWIR